jgi:hypothetical protein
VALKQLDQDNAALRAELERWHQEVAAQADSLRAEVERLRQREVENQGQLAALQHDLQAARAAGQSDRDRLAQVQAELSAAAAPSELGEQGQALKAELAQCQNEIVLLRQMLERVGIIV